MRTIGERSCRAMPKGTPSTPACWSRQVGWSLGSGSTARSKTLQTRYPSSSLNLGPPAEGNNVEGVVELAVAAPVQAVPVLGLAGCGRDWGGTPEAGVGRLIATTTVMRPGNVEHRRGHIPGGAGALLKNPRSAGVRAKPSGTV